MVDFRLSAWTVATDISIKMKSWKGCRGFDPHVLSQITNAMPPYLIGDEAGTPFPFSAASGASMFQHIVKEPNIGNTASDLAHEGPSNLTNRCESIQCYNNVHTAAYNTQTTEQPRFVRKTTCWEVLTLQLGDFVREQAAIGIVPTDDILQQEARKFLFGDSDPWNQTAADNPEWLDLFKKAHGITTMPSGNTSCAQSGNGRITDSSETPFEFGRLDQEDLMDLGIGDLSFDHHLEPI